MSIIVVRGNYIPKDYSIKMFVSVRLAKLLRLGQQK